MGDSVTSGTATFRERDAGLELTLQVSGLPEPEAEYFGEIHEGDCENGQQGGEPGAEFADASRPAPVTVRFELLSAESTEYAHGGEAHQDADVSLVGSADGTGQTVTLLQDYRTIYELLSGGPKYLDLHAPAPEIQALLAVRLAEKATHYDLTTAAWRVRVFGGGSRRSAPSENRLENS